MIAHVLLNLLNELGKSDATSLINSIILSSNVRFYLSYVSFWLKNCRVVLYAWR